MNKAKLILMSMFFLLFLSLFIRQTHEPDIWWQITTGEYIVKHLEVPNTDVFSFTHFGEPWINVKWASEVLMYLFSSAFGVENLMLLHFITVGLILFFQYKMVKLLYQVNGISLLFLMMSTVLLFLMSYRFNARPEMFSHFFSVVGLYILFLSYKKKMSFLWLMIPLQIVWTNMHEGYAIGLVLTAIFVASLFVEDTLLKRKKMVLIPFLVFAVQLFSVVIHPSGFKMLFQPFEIYNQLSENKYTTELLGIESPLYWNFFTTIFMVLVLFILFYLFSKFKKNQFSILAKTYGVFYLVLIIAFVYLGFGSQRNVIFFFLISFLFFYDLFKDLYFNENNSYYKFTTLMLALFIFVVSGSYYKILLPREKFGLAIDYKRNAIGAAKFINKHQLKGKCFSDYLISSYLLWNCKPEFKTYLDLRDLDIFSKKFMDNVTIVYNQPFALVTDKKTIWEYMCEADDFEYIVVLNGEEFKTFHQFIINNVKNYEPVYADGLCTIYVKKLKKYNELINKFSLENNKEFFSNYTIQKPNAIASFFTFIINPFWEFKPDENEFKNERRAYFNYIDVKN